MLVTDKCFCYRYGYSDHFLLHKIANVFFILSAIILIIIIIFFLLTEILLSKQTNKFIILTFTLPFCNVKAWLSIFTFKYCKYSRPWLRIVFKSKTSWSFKLSGCLFEHWRFGSIQIETFLS